jgi:DNA-binding NtrC family response regulator
VGGDKEIEVECRVIAATNRDPQIAINEGKLRSDLLYRLAGFPLSLPPLRDREGDAALLALHFLQELNASTGTWKQFSTESLRWIPSHAWPGNVRELHNAVQRAFILADDELDLRAAALSPKVAPLIDDAHSVRVPIGTSLAEAERWIVVATLKQCGGNKTRAAATLGLSLKTLYNRLHAYRAEDERGAHQDQAGD